MHKHLKMFSCTKHSAVNTSNALKMSQLMRLWYSFHIGDQRRLRLDCVSSPEPSLFADMKYGSRQRLRPKIRHLAPLDGYACAFEECVRRTKSTIVSWHVSKIANMLKNTEKKKYLRDTSFSYNRLCISGSRDLGSYSYSKEVMSGYHETGKLFKTWSPSVVVS